MTFFSSIKTQLFPCFQKEASILNEHLTLDSVNTFKDLLKTVVNTAQAYNKLATDDKIKIKGNIKECLSLANKIEKNIQKITKCNNNQAVSSLSENIKNAIRSAKTLSQPFEYASQLTDMKNIKITVSQYQYYLMATQSFNHFVNEKIKS